MWCNNNLYLRLIYFQYCVHGLSGIYISSAISDACFMIARDIHRVLCTTVNMSREKQNDFRGN